MLAKTVQVPTTPKFIFSEGKKAEYLFYLENLFRDNRDSFLGPSDAEMLTRLLAHTYEHHYIHTNFRIVIDIGANLGRLTHMLVNSMSDKSCREIVVPNHAPCRNLDDDIIILSFEPVPATFEFLIDATAKFGWEKSNLILLRAAGKFQF